jgi:hypothetical protein
MNAKSNPQLDLLIKRIYSSYIDIKSGDFKEIDKDILLNDISQLYVSIKDMYSDKSNQINAIEQEILNEKKEKDLQNKPETSAPVINNSFVEPFLKTEIIVNKEPFNNRLENPETPIEPIHELKKEEPKIVSTEFDLTMFMDNDDFETITSHPFGEKKIEPETTINDFKIEPKIDNYASIPDLTIPEDKTLINDIKGEAKSEPIVEVENKSTGKIMDFLHDGEQKNQKDIYSFLDINTRIGLVELFFKGNSLELTESLVKINKLDSKADCIAVVNKYASQFEVKETEDIYLTFLQLIDRKFSGL